MGFDKNDSRPIINPAKRTTQVNFSIAIAVLIFFAICGAAMVLFDHYHR
jgi:hypothetical protein